MSLTETFFNLDVLLLSLPALMRGLMNTLLLGALSIVFGVAAGLVLSLIRLYAPKPARYLTIAYIDVFRATLSWWC